MSPPRAPAVAALVLLLPVAAAWSLPAAAEHVHDDADILEDRFLLTFQEGRRGALAQEVRRHGGSLTFPEGLVGIALVDAAPGHGHGLEAALEGLAGVLAVDHDRVTRVDFVPDDPRFGSQYGPQQIRAPEAWDITRGSHAVRVAVLDTGVDLGHPDLVGNLCLTADFTSPAQGVQDTYGHGTHVAGTVAAGLSNGVGIAGLGNSCLLVARVLDGSGTGTFGWLVSAVGWALANDADVITMSLGSGGNPGPTVENALTQAFQQGVFLSASAGNAGCPQVLGGQAAGTVGFSAGYPGAYAKVMATAATFEGGGWDLYSNCGPNVDIAAPGTSVLSTLPPCTTGVELCSNSGYGTLTGTSMAAPHVAGTAALMRSVNPALPPREVFCFLAFTTHGHLGVPWDPLAGWGEVDALGAVLRARDGPALGQGPLGPRELDLCDRMLQPVPGLGSLL